MMRSYWRRCCMQRWPVCHVDNHGAAGSACSLELHLANLLKHFIPNTTDPAVILNLLPLCSELRRVPSGWITTSSPSVAPGPAPKRGSTDSGSEGEMEEPAMDHYQLDNLVAGLSHLGGAGPGIRCEGLWHELRVEPFLFTYRDCHSLAATVKACHTLKVPPTPASPTSHSQHL